MPFYMVTLPAGTEGAPRVHGHNTQIVFAVSAAQALAACKSLFSSDTDGAWGAATAVELAQQDDMEGVEVRVTYTGDVDEYSRVVSYVGVAGDDLADLAEGLKLALVAEATNIPTDATRSGLVVTIPAANNMGDKSIAAQCYLNGVAVDLPAVAVSATGAEASARTITLSGGTLEGSRLRVTVADPTNPVDVSVWLHDGETIDAAAARLVVLLNATTLLSNVAYASNVITIPGASDAQGAKAITAAWTRNGIDLPEMALTVNAAGLSSIDRTITFPADGTLPAPMVPRCIASAKT